MRKIIFGLLFILCLIILIFAINTNKTNGINESLVYIESFNDDSITSGSGVVYKVEDNKNYIITNYHVIKGYFNIYVYNKDNEKVKASIYSYDSKNDIAILIIEDKLNLKEAKIGDIHSIHKNDIVDVVGVPNSINNFGKITSGKILDYSSKMDTYNFIPIQVSNKTDFGNSGGPLLDKNGKVIGIVFLKSNDKKDVSYAIPIDFIMDFINKNTNNDGLDLKAIIASSNNVEALNKYGYEQSNIIGVIILDMDNESILKYGGIENGDIIVAINGVSIQDITNFKNEIYKYKIGDTLKIKYYRNGYFDTNIKF